MRLILSAAIVSLIAISAQAQNTITPTIVVTPIDPIAGTYSVKISASTDATNSTSGIKGFEFDILRSGPVGASTYTGTTFPTAPVIGGAGIGTPYTGAYDGPGDPDPAHPGDPTDLANPGYNGSTPFFVGNFKTILPQVKDADSTRLYSVANSNDDPDTDLDDVIGGSFSDPNNALLKRDLGINGVSTLIATQTYTLSNASVGDTLKFYILGAKQYTSTGPGFQTDFTNFNGNIPQLVTAVTLGTTTWNGGTGTWDTTSNNWLNGRVGAETKYTSPDVVLFNNTSTGTVTIQAGGVTPGGTFVGNDAAHPYTITGGGATGLGGTGNLTKSGVGSLTLSGTNTYTGATVINAGTVNVTGSHTTGASYTVATPATLNTTNIRTGAFTLDGHATVTQNGGTTGASKVSSLAISGTGLLNLKDNDLIVGGSTLAAVRSQIISGFINHTGHGITTDMPGAGTTFGLASAAGNDPNLSTFITNPAGPTGTLSGLPFTEATDVLVRYTYIGDADLDGDADIADVTFWLNNFTGTLAPGSGSKTWTTGDWDYDGDADIADVTFWLNNFTGTLTPGSGLVLYAPDAQPGAIAALEGLGLGITVVPEPGSISLLAAALGVGGVRMIRRRRKASRARASR